MNDERRLSERVATNLPVRWHGISGSHEDRIEDLSATGCFVNTKGAVDVGEMVRLFIQLPSSAWLPLRGKVIFFHQITGFSVAFAIDDEEQRQQLTELVAGLNSPRDSYVPDPTRRFTNRVKNYLKYRPRYPAGIIPLLKKECGLTRHSVVADIGSGTGFLT